MIVQVTSTCAVNPEHVCAVDVVGDHVDIILTGGASISLTPTTEYSPEILYIRIVDKIREGENK